MDWISKDSYYEGMWEHGRPKGYGKMKLPNGQIKEGYFIGNMIFKSEEEYK
jgi:hypothetical protein